MTVKPIITAEQLRDAIARATRAADWAAVGRLQQELADLPRQQSKAKGSGQTLTELSQQYRQAQKAGDTEAMERIKEVIGQLQHKPPAKQGPTWPEWGKLTQAQYNRLKQHYSGLNRK